MNIINDNGVYFADDNIDVFLLRGNATLGPNDVEFYDAVAGDRVALINTQTDTELYGLEVGNYGGKDEAISSLLELTAKNIPEVVTVLTVEQYVRDYVMGSIVSSAPDVTDHD